MEWAVDAFPRPLGGLNHRDEFHYLQHMAVSGKHRANILWFKTPNLLDISVFSQMPKDCSRRRIGYGYT